MLSIDRDSPEPFYQQVYRQIAQGIESGLYVEGNKLPSIRACAQELGVSITTIDQAYQRLTGEGYVEPHRGSGFVVCTPTIAPQNLQGRFSDEYLRERDCLKHASRLRSDPSSVKFDFAYDSVDADTFPFNTWSSICREVFFSAGASHACLYNDRQGLRDLREQIVKYIASDFGVHCSADQVLVMPTTGDIVTELIRLFNPEDTIIAMENPGYDEVSRRLSAAGYMIRELPVHPYPSWDTVEEILDGVRLVFSTPTSQFPTNRPMPLEYRKALVDWAKRTGSYIIDDEYGWELSTAVSRVPSLGALDDSGHVITLGTFSNSFTPAICLSYGILPPRLMLSWLEKHAEGHPQVPWQTQAAMAAFMREGHWPVHVRRIRTASRKKRQVILRAIEECFGDTVEVVESPNSLYVLLQTKEIRCEAHLVEAAADAGVRIYPTSQYWRGNPPDDWRYVLVGYAGIGIDAIAPGIEELARAWAR